jgi:hypothetical protein
VIKGVVEFIDAMTDQIWLRGRSKRRRVRQERWNEATWKGRRRLYEGRGVKETVSKEGERRMKNKQAATTWQWIK